MNDLDLFIIINDTYFHKRKHLETIIFKKIIGFGLAGFYAMHIGYLMQNPIFTYILNI